MRSDRLTVILKFRRDRSLFMWGDGGEKSWGGRGLFFFNPLMPNNDVSQTSHCNIKGVSVSEVMRIENMITQVQFH